MVGLYLFYVLVVGVGSWWSNRRKKERARMREVRGEYDHSEDPMEGEVEWETEGTSPSRSLPLELSNHTLLQVQSLFLPAPLLLSPLVPVPTAHPLPPTLPPLSSTTPPKANRRPLLSTAPALPPTPPPSVPLSLPAPALQSLLSSADTSVVALAPSARPCSAQSSFAMLLTRFRRNEVAPPMSSPSSAGRISITPTRRSGWRTSKKRVTIHLGGLRRE
jgi:hypothetical protein